MTDDDDFSWLFDDEDPEIARLRQERREIDRNMPVEKWLAIRKEEAHRIDPETAKVDWEYGKILDPYGVNPDLPPEADCIGRIYFALNPGSDIWVSFYDLPKETYRRLCERLKS